MKSDIILVLLFFSHTILPVNLLNQELSTNVLNTSTTMKINDLQIVGGYNCSIEEHPYMVSIRNTVNNTHICGGTLLSADSVLTAAHCCPETYEQETFSVVAGTSKFEGKGSQSSLVVKCTRYKDYDDIHFYNDIALISLKLPIKQSKYIRYINLPSGLDEDLEKVCSHSIVIGWGDQYAKNSSLQPLSTPVPPHDPFLHCVELSVVSHSNCEKIYNHKLPDTIICAYSENKGSCQGDSGGPLICQGVQYGVIASGIGCAYKNIPGLYTRIDKYNRFINVKKKRSNSATQYFLNRFNFYCNFYFMCYFFIDYIKATFTI